MVAKQRDADKQASRWSDYLSSFVRGSKGFSQLDRPRISLCDEKNFHSQFEAKLTFFAKDLKDFYFDS